MPINTGNMGGVGDLVRALTGRDVVRQQAEADAWQREGNIGRARKAAAEAGIAEDELGQRGGLADAILAAAPPGSMTPEQAAALATIGRGGFGNFPQLVQGQSGLFDLGQTQTAAKMALQKNPDTKMMNRVLIARTSGGGLLTPQTADPEGLLALIKETEQAQAGNYRASADAANRRATAYEYDVRSRADDRLLDNARGPTGSAGSASALTLAPDVMEMFKVAPPRSEPGAPRVFDQAKYEQFLADRASYGGTGNLSEDARQWIVNQQPQRPIFIDPTRPASMTRSPPAPLPVPSALHIQHLRANPRLKAAFDQKFGPGAAARAGVP